MNEEIVAAIQARTTSERFPEKVLHNFLKPGQTMLHKMVRTIESCGLNWVILTPNNKEQAPIGNLFFKTYAPAVLEIDVLGRYYEWAKKHSVKHIMRLTGDCPLISKYIILQLIKEYKKDDGKVYWGTDTYETVPDGLDVEIFPFFMLEAANEKAKSSEEREHVTSYLKLNFPYKRYTTKHNFRGLKLSVDTKDDLERTEEWSKIFQND